MSILFIILIIVASVVLGLIVLIQNPKGGGLAGNIAGFSNQFMGVKQTTDVLEKGTWIFAAVIAILCITSRVFIKGGSTKTIDIAAPAAPQQPVNNANTIPMQGNPSGSQTPLKPGDTTSGH